MADIRKVTDSFSVAPQLSPEDMAEAAAMGFTLVIDNRPEGEAPDQPSSGDMETAARAAGLEFVQIPVFGTPGPGQVLAVADAVATAQGPVLAYCRSGTRSIVTWSLGQHTSGAQSREDLIARGQAAGYDLSGVLRSRSPNRRLRVRP